MRLVAVGTGTVVPEGNRGGSCFYLEDEGSRLLIDCGPGAVQGLARWDLPWQSLTDLVITHFHADHIGALPGIFFALKHAIMPARGEPLTVWGPLGTRRLFSRLASAVGEWVLDPGFAVRIHELEENVARTTEGGLELSVRSTAHTEESHAVRIQGRDAAVGYTGDTGLPEYEAGALGSFLAGLDVLIAECSLSDDEVGDNHLSPGRLALLATVASPGLLWVTHVYPHVRRRDDVAELLSAVGYAGAVRVLSDGDGWSGESGES
jgi:ribonuclease BN (tRNA processing enzyme)